MIPRGYQERAVSRAIQALDAKGNTLVKAPTGAGKTIMLSMLSGRIPGKHLILQHRDELVNQNLSKYLQVNPNKRVSIYNATQKSWRGDATFAMVQTLSRDKNLESIPALDCLIVDEAHHVAANSYMKIIDKILSKSDKCKIAGVTATPNRGDGKALRSIFTNVADEITIQELINLGFLVQPKAFTLDVGVREELANVRKLSNDFDMDEVDKIMNKKVINSEVIKHWKEKAENRQTIIFCSTIAHADSVAEDFNNEGINTEIVTGETAPGLRRNILRRLETGETRIVVNVAVLTEGFDCPPVSCIILLRPCSFKSTMIQMIGRGLRTVDPEKYPGIAKRDCIILDFGTSIITHGNIETVTNLSGNESSGEDTGYYKTCPEEINDAYFVPDINGNYGCGSEVPLSSQACPICGFIFQSKKESKEIGTLENTNLTEVDIINRSPFKWVDIFGSGRVFVASGFDAAAIVASRDGETYYAFGRKNKTRLRNLVIGTELQSIAAADDFLRTYESENSAHKTKRWLKDPATERQRELLSRIGYQVGMFGFTKYSANAHLKFQWNKSDIERYLFTS